jgi:hypothetical protein
MALTVEDCAMNLWSECMEFSWMAGLDGRLERMEGGAHDALAVEV